MPDDNINMLLDKAGAAPDSPGVYIFRGEGGGPIYIGKAKSLRARLRSYFSKDAHGRARQMVSQAKSVDFIVTDSEAEALVLESSMIKRHYPKYNIDLKDNDRFTYILITDEKFPRMALIRRSRQGRISQKGKVFGPFTSGSANVLVASTLRRLFKLRTCKANSGRPCLQYHLGNCMGPCAGLVSEEDYNALVERLMGVLSGGKKLEGLISELGLEMKNSAKEKRFEDAIRLRNSIRALSSLLERQKFEKTGEKNEDYFASVEARGRAYVRVFRQIGGVIRDSRKYEFEQSAGGGGMMEFLPVFYDAGGIPPRIFLEEEPEGKAALEQYLSEKRGGKVEIYVPKKGDNLKLLQLLRRNIMLEVEGKAEPALVELQKELSLPSVPLVIECFDISNLFGSSVVGSMVRFSNGKPDKANYRRFKIRTVEGQDDFASMREIVFRRYYRLKKEKAKLPDLVLIDGGAGQLNTALSALEELGISIPVVSLAKEFEEIYHPDFEVPIRLARDSPALKVLQHARDEAHRFGIAYHRLLRKKGASGR